MPKLAALPKKPRQADKRLTLAIDFDGVIFDPSTKTVFTSSLDALDLLTHRFKVIVFSARAVTPAGQQFIRDVLFNNMVQVQEVTSIKPMADLYIDDKALHHVDWDTTLQKIEQRLGLPIIQI